MIYQKSDMNRTGVDLCTVSNTI